MTLKAGNAASIDAKSATCAITGTLALITLDQYLKQNAIFTGNATINTGVAFSIGSVLPAILGLLAVCVLLFRLKSHRTAIAILLLLSLSNFVDRWRFGGVVDYIQLGGVHINLNINLADAAIVSIIAFLIYSAATKNDTR